MIRIIKREDYSSEEEYQKAYKDMLEAIKEHKQMHSSRKMKCSKNKLCKYFSNLNSYGKYNI